MPDNAGIAALPQLRGTARLTPCPECGEPHGIIFRLGQVGVIECDHVAPPGYMLLHLHGPSPIIVVGAPIHKPEPKSPRRPA